VVCGSADYFHLVDMSIFIVSVFVVYSILMIARSIDLARLSSNH